MYKGNKLTKQPNIVLIIADTLRKDSLSVYNKNINTKNINNLGNDSVIYNNAIAPSSWTIPSHASLFTGTYPSEHRIHEERDVKLGDSRLSMNSIKYNTIAEILNKKGYNTLGLSENVNIPPGSGFDKGFNQYYLSKNVYSNIMKYYLLKSDLDTVHLSDIRSIKRIIKIFKLLYKDGGISGLIRFYNLYSLFNNKQDGYYYDKGGYTTTDIIENSSFKSPFFLFLNFFEMHEPYIKKDPAGTDNELKTLFGYYNPSLNTKIRIKNEYYKRTTVFDYYIGRIINFLKLNNIYDETMIIITSDHGQELYENGYYGHGIFLTDELIKIPLIIKYPGNIHMIKDDLISLVDIKNLILDGSISFHPHNEVVFSEIYGIHTDANFLKNYPEFYEKSKNIDIRRKAVFNKDYKMVINQYNKIEEFKYNGKNINVSDHKEIIDEFREKLDIFIGNEKFYS